SCEHETGCAVDVQHERETSSAFRTIDNRRSALADGCHEVPHCPDVTDRRDATRVTAGSSFMRHVRCDDRGGISIGEARKHQAFSLDLNAAARAVDLQSVCESGCGGGRRGDYADGAVGEAEGGGRNVLDFDFVMNCTGAAGYVDRVAHVPEQEIHHVDSL